MKLLTSTIVLLLLAFAVANVYVDLKNQGSKTTPIERREELAQKAKVTTLIAFATLQRIGDSLDKLTH